MEYKEYKLLSSGDCVSHHIMKINQQNFNQFKTTDGQYTLQRQKPTNSTPVVDASATPYLPFTRKTKSYSNARDYTMASVDPDKYPLILSDNSSKNPTTFQGNLQSDPSCTHALFVFSDDGFKVIPVSKFYKFNPIPKHRTLNYEEAEQKMGALSHKPAERWMMHATNSANPPKNSTNPQTNVKKEKDWKKKLLMDDAPENSKPLKKSKKSKGNAEELDFDEEFADDEDVDFGIEDQDEAKEASSRLYGKSSKYLGNDTSDLSDIEDTKTSLGKNLAKSLLKFEKNEAYENDEENPYISGDEDSDISPTKIKQETNSAIKYDLSDIVGSNSSKNISTVGMSSAEIALLRLKGLTAARPSTPEVKREEITNISMKKIHSSTEQTNDRKKRKIGDSDIAPAPPSAKQVIARQLEKERQKKNPKNVGSPQYSPSNSPSPQSSTALDTMDGSTSNILTDDDILRVIKSREQPFTVKEIVAELKNIIIKDPKNKDVLRNFIKTRGLHDKTTGLLTLKDST